MEVIDDEIMTILVAMSLGNPRRDRFDIVMRV